MITVWDTYMRYIAIFAWFGFRDLRMTRKMAEACNHLKTLPPYLVLHVFYHHSCESNLFMNYCRTKLSIT